MSSGKKIFYVCVACVCLTFGTIFLVIAFFMALGFWVGVMTVAFALPIALHKSLWNSENGLLTNFFFYKILNYYFDYHDRLENNLQFLPVLIQI